MPLPVADTVLDRTLELVEQIELTSLQWGFVEGGLPEEEVDGLAAQALAEAGTPGDPEDVVEELVERRLLIECPHGDGRPRLRSRFAEGVRLLARLRQLFPNREWQAAPTLVSDFRVDVRPRRVPRRNITAHAALSQMAALLRSPLRHDLASALLRVGTRDEVSLSAFQLRATQALLSSDTRDRGLVVSAGTGSGKTLAFYLPALVEIGSWVDRATPWTKALAVYPRRELLKDQFTEAFKVARRMDAALTQAGKRPITLGTYFGLTPSWPSEDAVQNATWMRDGNAYICPFLQCHLCGKEMVWRIADLQRGMERLYCKGASTCAGTATNEHLVLTRPQAVKQPPDLMFTTAEILNQRLSDTAHRRIFGIRTQRQLRVRLLLLDEVHTYEGASGAHAALMLRRWRHAVDAPVRFVGLSATLREAPEFFAQLTGVPLGAVQEIAPADDELVNQSTAYQLILRGDPVSQASLLSTSIQASFLLQRLLDPPAPNGGRSHGRFGSRTFVFTDDLDITNRLFDDLRDAEGYDMFGKPRVNARPLAHLRASEQADGPRREAAGQRWRVAEELGWQLEQPLRISRTTSQDAGVAAASDVVVATAALEIGFNDTTVGAVLQHKSPRQMAAFIQRKGRAGRTSTMRPWMVTVLSDYGRDRLSYQSYERLFDPVLDPQRLPIGNRYLVRMQAVFAFFDWVAHMHQGPATRGWWWQPLNGPVDDGTADWLKKLRAQQKALQETLRLLLRGDDALVTSLTSHLSAALQLSREEISAILWEAPRSLLLEVVPTLARRLYTNWAVNPELAGTVMASGLDHVTLAGVCPLPDFVPANLFSDLSLPEVTVALPAATVNARERFDTMPIASALRQLAPGRVTRRFAFERGGLSHWVPVPLTQNEHLLPVSTFASEYQYVADVPVLGGEDSAVLGRLPCYRPRTVHVERIPARVNASSNAFLHWGSELIPHGEGASFQIDELRQWGAIVQRVVFHMHTLRSPLTVRRFATGATATVRLRGRDTDHVVQTTFTDPPQGETERAGGPAAIGFEQDVDGLCLQIRLPSAAGMTKIAASAPELPAWRAAYLRDRILEDPSLSQVTNWFQRDWLAQVYVSAILMVAAQDDGRSLEQAAEQLHQTATAATFRQVLSAIFQVFEEDDDGTAASEEEETPVRATPRLSGPAHLRDRLSDLLGRPAILARLRELGRDLWQPDEVAWGRWLVQRTHETLGEATLFAILQVAPRHATMDNLLLDIQQLPGPAVSADGAAEIWITESTLGGAGVIEAFARAYAANPRTFFQALEATLAPSDLELTSVNLDRFVELAVSDSVVGQAVADLRGQTDHGPRDQSRIALYRLLAQRGLSVDHAFSSALNHRLLRAGVDASVDRLLRDILHHWRALEVRLGVAIDLRVFAFLASQEPTLASRIVAAVRAITTETTTPDQIIGVLVGLLWARPSEMRARFLDSYSPFRSGGHTDPTFIRRLLLCGEISDVALADSDWEHQLQQVLAASGTARLVAALGQESALHTALTRIIATPVDLEFLQFFPTIDRIEREQDALKVTLVLREVA